LKLRAGFDHRKRILKKREHHGGSPRRGGPSRVRHGGGRRSSMWTWRPSTAGRANTRSFLRGPKSGGRSRRTPSWAHSLYRRAIGNETTARTPPPASSGSRTGAATCGDRRRRRS
jgi:hypothetical protein